VPGCTTTGGVDNCPPGETCVMGMCTTAGSDAGSDAASDSGGRDAGGDGGGHDAGSSSSGSSGAGSSSGSGGAPEGGSSGGAVEARSSGGGMDGGANADAPVSLEGGGCDLTGDPASSLLTWTVLAATFAAAGVVRRRRSRGQ
jgi:hypothetical protein